MASSEPRAGTWRGGQLPADDVGDTKVRRPPGPFQSASNAVPRAEGGSLANTARSAGKRSVNLLNQSL